MIIKYPALNAHLKTLTQDVWMGFYFLIGSDHFLLNEAATQIRNHWRANHPTELSEEKIITVESVNDWNHFEEEINTYSLFTRFKFIDLRYEKKTLDASAKSSLLKYFSCFSTDLLVILRAPHLPQKSLQNFLKQPYVHLIQASPLNNTAVQRWISEELSNRKIQFHPQVPELIYQYTQGNMLASIQAVEKISLYLDSSMLLTTELIQEHLVNQCHYSIFELSDACLSSNPNKVIEILHYAHHHIEPILVLWTLTQEIRQLIRLLQLVNNKTPFNLACNQLNIWSYKEKLYQATLKRISSDHLLQLLEKSKQLDERIKSTSTSSIWHSLEQMALSLCLGKPIDSMSHG